MYLVKYDEAFKISK